MKHISWLVVFFAILLFLGCLGIAEEFSTPGSGSSGSESSPGPPEGDYGYYKDSSSPEIESGSVDYFGESAAEDTMAGSLTVLSDNSVVLKTKEASISIKVDRGQLESKLSAARRILENKDAEITSVFYDESEGQKRYSLTFKILPADFDDTLEAVKALGKVQSVDVDVEDVTKQYTDLTIRITNKELELLRLYELYNVSQTVNELLIVEGEITRVTTEVEQLKSQKESLESRISMSKITLELFEQVSFSEAKEGDVGIRVNDDELDSKVDSLKTITKGKKGEIVSSQLTESSTGRAYNAVVRLDSDKFDAFMQDIRELGEVKSIVTTVDEENRPERSLVYVNLVEEKSALQTSLFVPLETLLNTFLGSLSAAVLILSALLGFALPAIIILLVLYFIYKKVRKKPVQDISKQAKQTK